MSAMLEVRGLDSFYGLSRALAGIDLTVAPGEAVAVLGANGAGKTTLMRSIAGLEPPRSTGEIRLSDARIDRMPAHIRARVGVVLVPEGRGIFGPMSVRENLDLGAYRLRDQGEFAARLDRVLGLFPRLKERLGQIAGSMSGGEQQMLAVGRALMAGPKILLLDEPSLGLAPRVTEEILSTLGRLNAEGLAIVVKLTNGARLTPILAAAWYAFSRSSGVPNSFLSATGSLKYSLHPQRIISWRPCSRASRAARGRSLNLNAARSGSVSTTWISQSVWPPIPSRMWRGMGRGGFIFSA